MERCSTCLCVGAVVGTKRFRTCSWEWSLDRDGFAQRLFLPDTLLTLYGLHEFQGLSAMQVQLNLFNDGGYGLGIKMVHCLADAQALMAFASTGWKVS